MRAQGILVVALFVACVAARSQTVDVRAQVSIHEAGVRRSSASAAARRVVLWLKPIEISGTAPALEPGHYRMTQKNKMFEPHLLVIPLGSTITFPNLDPFFHNVFSQFNGKRFDLGLYEAGSSRTVRFDHEGVSYIFCNIHPEMSAVVITVSNPWYVVASPGAVTLHDVPAGVYQLHAWAEGVDMRQLDALTRRVRIGPGDDNLGPISITVDPAPHHKNKFGEDYRPDTTVY